MSRNGVTQAVVCAGGLSTRTAGWTRYIPKEFYPVRGRPGIVHLLEEIAQSGPAGAAVVTHPYYSAFTSWAGAALSGQGHDSYRRAARLAPAAAPVDEVAVSFITQRGPYADITSVLNGADYLPARGDLYVAFADNLYPVHNPLLALRAAPAGHLAVLARGYQPELAASRGVIAAAPRDGRTVMLDLAEKPGPPAARALEQRYGTGHLLLLEGRARLTPGFVRFARSYRVPPGTGPKLAAAIAAWARAHPVIVITTTSLVIDLGPGRPADARTGQQHPATPERKTPHAAAIPWKALRSRQLACAAGHRRRPVRDPGLGARPRRGHASGRRPARRAGDQDAQGTYGHLPETSRDSPNEPGTAGPSAYQQPPARSVLEPRRQGAGQARGRRHPRRAVRRAR